MTEKKKKKTIIGVVVSDKMQKTIVVEVQRLVKHSTFKKFVRIKKKFMAHDEKDQCRVGNRVEIMESRPLSARKRWVLNKILESSQTLDLPEAKEV